MSKSYFLSNLHAFGDDVHICKYSVENADCSQITISYGNYCCALFSTWFVSWTLHPKFQTFLFQSLVDMAPKYILEQFLEAELLVNIIEHKVGGISTMHLYISLHFRNLEGFLVIYI